MAVIPKYQSTRRIEGINSIPSGGRTSTENIARDAAAQKEAIQGVEETENALVKVRQIQQINAASTYATEAMNALKDKADQDPDFNGYDKYVQELNKIGTDAAKNIDGELAKNEFMARYAAAASSTSFSIKSLFRDRQVKAAQADFYQTSTPCRNHTLTPHSKTIRLLQ